MNFKLFNYKNIKVKIILLMFISIGSTGCMKGFVSGSVDLSSLTDTVYYLTGKELYNNKCSRCHHALEVSEVRNKTITDFKAAIIKNKEEMSFANNFTESQKELIIFVLNNDKPKDINIGITITSSKIKVQQSNRFGMKSILRSIFNDGGAFTNNTLKNIVKKLVGDKPQSFGGANSAHDQNQRDGSGTDNGIGDNLNTDYPIAGLATVTRRGHMKSLCDHMLTNDTAIKKALSNSGLSESSPPNEASMSQLFGTFAAGKSPSDKVLSSLINLFTGAKNDKGMSNLDSWRMTMTPLCLSPFLEMP